MKKFKLSRRAITVSLVGVAAIVALGVALVIGNNLSANDETTNGAATNGEAANGEATNGEAANDDPHAHIEMQVSLDGTIANVQLFNYSENEYLYGMPFALYRYFDGTWRRVSFARDEGWEDIGLTIPPNAVSDRPPIDLYHFFGDLPSGEYRIVIDVHEMLSDERLSDSMRVAGGFTLYSAIIAAPQTEDSRLEGDPAAMNPGYIAYELIRVSPSEVAIRYINNTDTEFMTGIDGHQDIEIWDSAAERWKHLTAFTGVPDVGIPFDRELEQTIDFVTFYRGELPPGRYRAIALFFRRVNAETWDGLPPERQGFYNPIGDVRNEHITVITEFEIV